MSVLNSDCAGELLGSASNLIMHSGNIASWSKLRKKGVLTSTDEVSNLTFVGASALLQEQSNKQFYQRTVYVVLLKFTPHDIKIIAPPFIKLFYWVLFVNMLTTNHNLLLLI